MKRILHNQIGSFIKSFALAAAMCAGIGLSSAAEPLYFPGTGHYYELLQTPSVWQQARASAQASSYLGMNGYLAAINSAEENAFFTDTIAPLAALGPRFEIWVGGHQPAGSPEPGGGWSWLSGEPWTYSNWSAGQPNNSWGGTEYVLTFYVAPNEFGNIGEWGDAPDNITSWFVVEYAVPEPSPAILLVLAGSLAALRQRFVFNRCWK